MDATISIVKDELESSGPDWKVTTIVLGKDGMSLDSGGWWGLWKEED